MKFKFQKVLVIFMISFILFAIFLTASYSYFAAQGVGSGDDRQVTTTVGQVKLLYLDGSEYFTSNNGFEPGDYLLKTFDVINESPTTAYYTLYMDDVINTFIMQKKDEQGNTISDAPYELIYTLKKNDQVVISEELNTPVLTKAGEIYRESNMGIEIPVGKTDRYELMIKFVDTGENQNYNQSKMFSAKIDFKIKDNYERFTLMLNERNDLILDDYNNIRFVGKEANNYISFNNEEWRIIGLFKDIEVVSEDGTTKKEDLIKIVRNNIIGNIAWDSKGENDWTNSTLMQRLNGDYLNGGNSYSATSTVKGLNNVKNLIENVRWHIGGNKTPAITAKNMYIRERGDKTSSLNPSTFVWDGKVALMYPSDYGYSSDGEVLLNQDTGEKVKCSSTNMSVWNSNKCYTSSWIYSNNFHQFLITPYSESNDSVFPVHTTGSLAHNYTNVTHVGVRPSLFLKANIGLIGTGERGSNAFRIVE